jgi:hypothetical protein
MTPKIEIEVWCSCGNGLCSQTKVSGTSLTVDPCEECLEEAHDEGKADGIAECTDKLETKA